MFTDIVDLHVHASPRILPRRYSDGELLRVAHEAGVATIVLKAHEGSTAERAQIAGAVGGIVLNSPAGGANPDAVRVAALLGGRIVWMPTVSAEAHIRSHGDSSLGVHRQHIFQPVPVTADGALRPEWLPVLEVVAEYNLVLASGHLAVDEAVCLFQAARAAGCRRFLVNHPLFPFQGWRDEHVAALRALDARIEIGVLADYLAAGSMLPSAYFLRRYPAGLLVFGSDLGHIDFPDYPSGLKGWIQQVAPLAGEARLQAILASQGKELLFP